MLPPHAALPDAYCLPPPPPSTMTPRDAPHRLAERRDRRAIGRISPYARPHAVHQLMPRPVHPSYREHVDRMFPPDHDAQAQSPVSPLLSPRSINVPVRPLYRDTATQSPGQYRATVDDWRAPDLVALHPPSHWSRPLAPQPLPVVPPAATLPRGSMTFVDAASPRSPVETPTAVVAPDLTLVGQLCAKRNCYRHACQLYGDFCEFHKPSRLCKVPECRKCAKTGGYCIAHGGGRRCQADGCTKSAKEGGRCIAHGGGKRCRVDGCEKTVVAAADRCATHCTSS